MVARGVRRDAVVSMWASIKDTGELGLFYAFPRRLKLPGSGADSGNSFCLPARVTVAGHSSSCVPIPRLGLRNNALQSMRRHILPVRCAANGMQPWHGSVVLLHPSCAGHKWTIQPRSISQYSRPACSSRNSIMRLSGMMIERDASPKFQRSRRNNAPERYRYEGEHSLQTQLLRLG